MSIAPASVLETKSGISRSFAIAPDPQRRPVALEHRARCCVGDKGSGSAGRSRSHLIRRGGRSLLSIGARFCGGNKGPGSVGRSRSHLIRRGGRSLLSIAPAFAGLVGQARQRARFELLAVPRVSHHQVSTVLRCAEVYCFASTEARLQDGSRALLGTCRQ